MTSSYASSPSLATLSPSRDDKKRLPLLETFLREQQSMTAVERFAQRHADADAPLAAGRYRDLLPATPPGAGQQYAFEVDLDACTGCKACVTACHNLNGLDEGEAWRTVGLLHGGTAEHPVQQTITTACHHCVDPACMSGCPVRAYEKDPRTGIVRHLDDQCIGCQYCTFTCPYEAPKYNAARGIVRKCDMCSDRLAAGEAPACVQACPNEAIAVRIVDVRQAIEDAQGDSFVPGAPSPGMTIPATVYKTARALPRNVLPADFYSVRPSHCHVPLVVMLVLTQLSVGAFCVDALDARGLSPAVASHLGPVHAAVALALGLAALGASVLHLGRPLYAYRAVLGLRTSWMSREILAFGAFAAAAAVYASSFWAAAAAPLEPFLRGVVAGAGIAGVLCSAMIYAATRRAWWGAPRTVPTFLLTSAVLGLATTALTTAIAACLGGGKHGASELSGVATAALHALFVAAALKAAGELLIFRHLRDRRQTELRRSAALLVGDLRSRTIGRFALLAAGIVACWAQLAHPLSIPGAVVALAFLAAGELLERVLFFAALSAPGMPGGGT